jgi:hypothetical protein
MMGRTGKPGTSTTLSTGLHFCYRAVLCNGPPGPIKARAVSGVTVTWAAGRGDRAVRGPRTLRAKLLLQAMQGAGTVPAGAGRLGGSGGSRISWGFSHGR